MVLSAQVQKEYRKCVYRASWLPESLRLKYGGVTGTVAATTVNNQSSSSTTGRVNVRSDFHSTSNAITNTITIIITTTTTTRRPLSIVVSVVGRTNEVNQHWARLVL